MADGVATTHDLLPGSSLDLSSCGVSDAVCSQAPADEAVSAGICDDPDDIDLLRGKMAAIERSHTLAGFDLDGTILYVNQKILDVLGYTREMLVGRSTDILLSPKTIDDDTYRDRWAALRAGRHVECELRLLRADGREVWLRNAYHPVIAADGRIRQIFAFGNVITDDVLLRREHEKQIEAIDNSQCVAAFALDGTILSANPRFCVLFGYEPDELIGRHHGVLRGAGEICTPEYLNHWEVLRNGQFRAGVFRCVGKAGNEIWLQATYCPFAR